MPSVGQDRDPDSLKTIRSKIIKIDRRSTIPKFNKWIGDPRSMDCNYPIIVIGSLDISSRPFKELISTGFCTLHAM